MAGFGPTPDWNTKTVAWAGVALDGTPLTGTIKLNFNAPVPLIDASSGTGVPPVAVYPVTLTQQLTTTTIMVGGVSKTVGYATFQVPASNDPDIQGLAANPITYTYTEDLNGGAVGQTRTVFIDKDATEPYWLNLASAVNPSPGVPISAVTRAEFDALAQQVAAGGGGGGAAFTNYSQVASLAGYPTSFPPTTHNHTAGQLPSAETLTNFTEAVQDVTGAMIVGAGGTYNDAAGAITLPAVANPITGDGTITRLVYVTALPGTITNGTMWAVPSA